MMTFQKFREGMQSDNIEEKLEFVKQVPSVAKEMGKEATISTLIPFLNDWCPDNDDEALSTLAKEIYNLKELFSPDEMKHVIPTLKHLATTEEVVVRDAATESINKIVEIMSPEVVFEALLVVIDSLCRDEWFTPRVSCTALITKVYSKLTELMKSRDVFEQLRSLRDSFFALCKDDTPMVRRAAARNLSSVFSVIEDEYVPLFVAQYEEFMNMDDDPIKNALLSFTPMLLSRTKIDSDRAKVISLFRTAMESRSFHVREAAAMQVGAVATILGEAVFLQELKEVFMTMLKDTYSDVRQNAVKQLVELSKVVERSVFSSQFMDFLPTLAVDTTQIVEELARVSVDLMASFPDEMAALLPLLLTNHNSQVRLIILRRLNEITLTEEQIKQIVLDEKLDGSDWRVREEVARHMDCLLKYTETNVLKERLISIYLDLFRDAISRVREICRTSLCGVISTFGFDYAYEKVISKLVAQYDQETNYLYQFNLLYTFEKVIAAVPQDDRCAGLLAYIQEALNKPVPNLRFIACRILTNLKDVLPVEVKTAVVAKMKEMTTDEDRDVRYYAEKGIQALA